MCIFGVLDMSSLLIYYRFQNITPIGLWIGLSAQSWLNVLDDLDPKLEIFFGKTETNVMQYMCRTCDVHVL